MRNPSQSSTKLTAGSNQLRERETDVSPAREMKGKGERHTLLLVPDVVGSREGTWEDTEVQPGKRGGH